MKKNVWKLVGAILVLVLLIIGYVAVTVLNPEEEEDTEEEVTSIEVNTFDTEEVTELSYNSEKGNLTFKMDAEIWYYADDKSCPIDQSRITAMLNSASSVTATQLVEENKENFSSFGLDEPKQVITYKLSSGESKTYNIGNYNELVSSYYFNLEGEDKVYLIDTTLFNSFDFDLMGLVDLEEYPVVSATDIYSFTITNGKKTVYAEDSNDAAHKKNDSEIPESEWVMGIKKNKLEKTNDKFEDNVVQSIVNLTNSGCVEYNADKADYKKYGLDEPAYTLVINYTETKLAEEETETEEETTATPAPSEIVDKQFTIYIGGAAESGEYYVNMKGSNMIHTMNVTGIDKVLEVLDKE